MFPDVYSYDEDDMVEDPYLAKHLAHFGIDIMSMQKVGYKAYIFIATYIKVYSVYTSLHWEIFSFIVSNIL